MGSLKNNVAFFASQLQAIFARSSIAPDHKIGLEIVDYSCGVAIADGTNLSY